MSFDPLAAFFLAQSEKPSHFREVDITKVSPFLRSLMVKDGTVTSALSAYFWEAIATRQLAQREEPLSQSNPWLKLDLGGNVIRRQVVLTGEQSRRLFLFAESELAPERLPEEMRQKLQQEHSNLGQLLREGHLETRREGLWFGLTHLTDLPSPVATACDGVFLSRTYRILSQSKPLMLVTEHFPMTSFS